jgi:hypothetical protein
MNAKLTHRVERLEESGSADDVPEEEPLRIMMWKHGQKLSLDHDTCLRILREAGYRTGFVCLDSIPDGLSAAELTRFLREDGATICGE